MSKYFKLVSEINYMGGGIFRYFNIIGEGGMYGWLSSKIFLFPIHLLDRGVFFLNKYMLTFLILSYHDRFM